MNEQIVINGQLISYSKFGSEGAGRTLVFLHGWRSSKEVWQHIVESLKSSSHQVYTIDLPGFGGSPVPHNLSPALPSKGEGVWGVGDYAGVVAEFVKKLDLKNVIIVGHSFGGRVGIKLCALHPELASKLVLVDSAGFRMPGAKKSILGLAAKLVKPFFRPKFMQGLRQKIYSKIGAEDYVATPELQRIFVNIVGEDLSEDMKKISQPTLIIWGGNDKDTPVEFGQRMQLQILNSKLKILPNAGHFSFLDQSEEFVKILNEFI